MKKYGEIADLPACVEHVVDGWVRRGRGLRLALQQLRDGAVADRVLGLLHELGRRVVELAQQRGRAAVRSPGARAAGRRGVVTDAVELTHGPARA